MPRPDPTIDSEETPTILLVVRPGPAARFVLRTDILETLRESARVVILTPEDEIPEVAAAVDDSGVPVVALRRASRQGSRRASVRALIQRIRRHALDGHKSERFYEKYRSRRTTWSRNAPVMTPLVDLLIRRGLWRSARLRELTVRTAVRVAEPLHGDLFERYRPELVVTTGLGYTPWDEGILQEAQQRGVRRAAVIHNWDNPSTGGYRSADLDLVVAWSGRMREQLVELQDVPADRIRVAGVPHWDPYVRDGAVPSREELCARLGLDPDRRIILHATHRPRGHIAALELASVLARATSEEAFGPDAQLLIRLHPKFMPARHDAARLGFDELATQHADVHVNHPVMRSVAHEDIDPSDTPVLGGMLKHCDVLVNVFSTTTLEGFLLDRPVVLAAPEAHLPKGEAEPVDSRPGWERYAHLDPILSREAAPIAYSDEELIAHIRRCLDHPEERQELRQAIVQAECGPTDGFSGRRTAHFLLELTSARPPAEGESVAVKSLLNLG